MEAILNKVRDYADNAHGSQMRKYSPERYIVHPIRVMETCKKYDDDIEVLAAALLHDVLEDTPVTEDELLEFLQTLMSEEEAQETLKLVIELTDVYTKEAYPQWNRKKRKEEEHKRISHISPKAQTIKYADTIDNTNEITVHDPGFAPRYLKECLTTLQVAKEGNQQLYTIAMAGVQNGLNSLRKH